MRATIHAYLHKNDICHSKHQLYIDKLQKGGEQILFDLGIAKNCVWL